MLYCGVGAVTGHVVCLDSDSEPEPEPEPIILNEIPRNLKSTVVDDCVTEWPSCSRRPSAAVVDLEFQGTTVMSETRKRMPDFSRREVEILSLEDIMKQIPTMNSAPNAFEQPYMPSEMLEEIERPRKKQKKSDVASLANPICDADRQLKLREKELELERKEAQKAEKKREKEEAKKKQQEEILKKKEVIVFPLLKHFVRILQRNFVLHICVLN